MNKLYIKEKEIYELFSPCLKATWGFVKIEWLTKELSSCRVTQLCLFKRSWQFQGWIPQMKIHSLI